jgi:hypothetical protein
MRVDGVEGFGEAARALHLLGCQVKGQSEAGKDFAENSSLEGLGRCSDAEQQGALHTPAPLLEPE